MDSRSRVKRACALEPSDRIPVDFWVTDQMAAHLQRHFQLNDKEELLDLCGSDLRYIAGPPYIGPPLQTYADGSKRDLWGVRRMDVVLDTGVTYNTVLQHPLAEVTSYKEIEAYPFWPDPDWFDYGGLVEQCDKHPGKALVFSGGRLNRTSQLKLGMYLRGIQRILEDTIDAPAMLEALLARVVDFYLEFNRRIFEACQGKLDIFMMGDDFGTQSGLMMSQPAWRRFFRPGLARFIQLAKDYGITVMHHSCGAIEPLIPAFIDLGLDVLNPIQPEAAGMKPERLKHRYGKHIAFHGGIGIQQTMHAGTPESVQDEVDARSRTFGNDGGYIICTAHNIQRDVRLANVEALMAAYGRLRR